MYLSSVTNVNVSFCNIRNSTFNGILVMSSSNVIIKNTTVAYAASGLVIFDSTQVNINDSRLFDNGYEFGISSSSEIYCNNTINNVLGPNNYEIKFVNSKVTIQDKIYDELLLCDADDSYLDNICAFKKFL